MAKRRPRKQDNSGGTLLLLLVGLAVLGGIGTYLLKALAWAAVSLGVVVYALLAALLFDLVAVVYAKLRGESRPFTATRWVWAVVSYPFRLIGRAIAWWQGPPLRVQTIGELLMLTPTQFEEAIANLLNDHGYRNVQRVGGAGDLGVDITCRDPQGRSVAVQCKRYGPGKRVASKDLQLFIGMTTVHHRVDRGLYVTTSSFTQPAAALAEQHGIELIDGERLARLLPHGVPAATPAPPMEEFVEFERHDLEDFERMNRTGFTLRGEIVRPIAQLGERPRHGILYHSAADAHFDADQIEAFTAQEAARNAVAETQNGDGDAAASPSRHSRRRRNESLLRLLGESHHPGS